MKEGVYSSLRCFDCRFVNYVHQEIRESVDDGEKPSAHDMIHLFKDVFSNALQKSYLFMGYRTSVVN